MAFKASGRELWVGSDRQYSHLHDAVAAAHDGDTIYVEAGVYENDFSTIRDSVRIVGVGGTAHFKNTESSIDNGKAIFVVRDADVVIQNLEFSGAKVSDHNGAGIRFESGSLRVEDSYFHHNENGILAGTSNGRITVDNSEFAYNGRGDGYTHGIYAGKIDSLTVTDSYFHDTRAGHHIKSRADETTIVNNRLMDAGGDASYNIDLPNGNDAVIRHNVIEQSAESANRAMVHYGGEASSYSGSLIVDDNVFISHGGNGLGVRNQTPITVRIEDNTFHNVDRIATGPNNQTHNTIFDDLSHIGDSNPTPTPDPDPTPTPDPDPIPDSADASLSVRVSADDYSGDPQFRLYVDGHQIGSAKTVSADHDQGEWQTFNFTGNFDADSVNEVAVRFADDAWGGSSGADRNLYVDYIELGGTRIQAEDAVYERSNGQTLHGQQEMSWNGDLVFDPDPGPKPKPHPTPDPDPVAASSDTSLLVRVSGDDYKGDPKFSLHVDGQKIGSTEAVTADHSQGEWQTFKFTGDFGADGPDKVEVRFSDDAWGGSSGADRNLHVDYIELGGTRIQAEDAVYERSNGQTLHGQQEMSWNGSLAFDTHDVSLLGVASHPVNDGMTG